MTQLTFQITGAAPAPFAMAPTIAFKLRIDNADREQAIQNIMLRCQIQIEATRRGYASVEQDRLFDLYGEPQRWGQTLRTMLWTHTSVTVLPFVAETVVDLPATCTFDFNVAATKYFAALSHGEAPLCFLFSGTVFYEDQNGAMQVAQIPWEKEATYRLPVTVWRKMMDLYYPNQNWLTLRRDVFERLDDYKRRHGIPTWEQAFETLLSATVESERMTIAAGEAS